MGIIYAELRLSNLGKRELEEITVTALVDTRALDLVVPEHVAIQLQLTDLSPAKFSWRMARVRPFVTRGPSKSRCRAGIASRPLS
ncbi:MAG: hypothetical protein WKH97_03565 [Casimicrobiaceae bacterium]